MRNVFITILALCAGIQVWAQEQESLDSLIQRSRFAEAIRLIETMEPSRELTLRKISCYKAMKLYRSAKKELIILVDEYPDDITLRAELALCYEAIDEPKASLECYEQLIAMDSTNQYFRFKKGDMLYANENYDSAIVVFRKLVEQDSLISAVKRLAQCHDKIHEYESAALYYQTAYSMDTTDINALGNLINTHLKIQNYKNAIDISENYIAKDSTNNLINLMNALGYYGLDDYEKAVPRFTRCYNNNDTSLIVNRSLGISLYSLNENVKALPYLENAFRQDSTNNNVLYCMAITYSDLKRHKESLECYLKLLKRLTPKNMEMFLYNRNAANQYYDLQEYENALQFYNRAITYGTEQQNLDQYYAIAFLYRDHFDNPKKALEYFDLYIEGLTKSLQEIEQKQNKDEFDLRDLTEIRISLRSVKETVAKLKNQITN